MKRLTIVVLAVVGLAFAASGCEKIKELTGGDKAGDVKAEPKADEAAAAAEAAKKEVEKAKEEAEKIKADAEKAKADAEAKAKEALAEAEKKTEQVKADAEKAKVEAEAKTAGATAEADKAKAEAEAKAAAALAEAESTRKLAAQEVARAQDEKAKAEEEAVKIKKETFAKELTELTKLHAELKTELAGNLAAWKAANDEAKAAERQAILDELTSIEGDRTAAEAAAAADKLDEAQVKLDGMKAKLDPLKTKVAGLIEERPVDANRWNTMMQILAEETCMTKNNLPAQEFQKMREVLFAQYEMERAEYEAMRAQFTKASKPEDQAKLGEMVNAKCPEKTPEEKAAEEKEKEKKEYDGKWSGKVSLGNASTTSSLYLKGNYLSGKVSLGGVTFKVTGAVGGHSQFTGRTGTDYINCRGKRYKGEISGSCNGTLARKRLTGKYSMKFSGVVPKEEKKEESK